MQSARVKLSRPQADIYEAGWTPQARFRVGVAGRRGGKTVLAEAELRRAARLIIRNNVHLDNEIWYAAPTFTAARNNFWRRMKSAIPLEWQHGRPNEVAMRITLISGHVIRAVGLDDYERLRGAGLYFFIGDEWATCKPAAWPEVIRPMLSTVDGHALFIGTPKGFDHFYDFYVLGQPGPTKAPDTLSWQFTTAEGGNVSADEMDAARRLLDPRTYRQEYHATFETFEGRVYYAFNRKQNVDPAAVYDPKANIEIGMDFNINPMSATCFHLLPNGFLHQFDEIVIPTANTDDMAKEIVRRFGRRPASPHNFDGTLKAPDLAHVTVHPDPAGAQRKTSAQGRTDISILREYGLTVLAAASHPLVRDRINITNARFMSATDEVRLLVAPGCIKSIEAYERHVYKEGTGEPDKDTGFDHLCDATGYMTWNLFGAARAELITSGHMAR